MRQLNAKYFKYSYYLMTEAVLLSGFDIIAVKEGSLLALSYLLHVYHGTCQG